MLLTPAVCTSILGGAFFEPAALLLRSRQRVRHRDGHTEQAATKGGKLIPAAAICEPGVSRHGVEIAGGDMRDVPDQVW